jgi:hypothetical protein
METKLRIAEHPWSLVAFGALAGVWLATYGRPRPRVPATGPVMSAIGTFALHLVRDATMYEMSRLARTLLAEPSPPPPTPYAS